MKQITVIGSSGLIPQEVYKMAEELGENIAEAGAVLITGGRDGVMEAACKGAKKRGGLTVGILPGSKGEANPYNDITVVTGMGARLRFGQDFLLWGSRQSPVPCSQLDDTVEPGACPW